jgi:hypothetical protein
MHDLFGGAAGEQLELAAYYADFEKDLWSTSAPGF